MSEIERLAAAIKTISETYLTRVVARGDIAAIQKWSLRLADYSTRLAVLTAPAGAALAPEERAAVAVEPALSDDPSIAMHQILAATGHPVRVVNGETFAVDPNAVLADATPLQVQQLALLGFFGNDVAANPAVDWSLFLANYEETGAGNWQPTAAYEAAGGWAGYVAGAK